MLYIAISAVSFNSSFLASANRTAAAQQQAALAWRLPARGTETTRASPGAFAYVDVLTTLPSRTDAARLRLCVYPGPTVRRATGAALLVVPPQASTMGYGTAVFHALAKLNTCAIDWKP